jgi:flagellar biosynthetic protein FliR
VDLSLLTVNTVIAFLLILFRISGMLVSAPLFNMRSVPMQPKIGLAFTMALILFPLYSANLKVPTDLIQFAVMGIQEVILGLMIGFVANLFFIGLQMAGEFISFQMGLSVANILDPVTQAQVPVIGQFFFYFAALLFLSLNIHHALILGVGESFKAVPLGTFFTDGGMMAERFIKLTSEMFVTAMVIGVPIMGILLVLEIALSFVAKVMPQMNIFMVGIPLKVGVGLILIMVSLPFLGQLLGDQYAHLVHVLKGLYRT